MPYTRTREGKSLATARNCRYNPTSTRPDKNYFTSTHISSLSKSVANFSPQLQTSEDLSLRLKTLANFSPRLQTSEDPSPLLKTFANFSLRVRFFFFLQSAHHDYRPLRISLHDYKLLQALHQDWRLFFANFSTSLQTFAHPSPRLRTGREL